MLSAHTGATHIRMFAQNVSTFTLRILHIQKFQTYVTITTIKTSNVFHTTYIECNLNGKVTLI